MRMAIQHLPSITRLGQTPEGGQKEDSDGES